MKDYVFSVLCVVSAGACGAVGLGDLIEPLFHGAFVGSGPGIYKRRVHGVAIVCVCRGSYNHDIS